MDRLTGIVFLINLISNVYCGELVVPFSPSYIEFSAAAALRLSDLDDVVATSMGCTSQGSGWRGLTVKSPFKYPSAAVIIDIPTEGVPLKQSGIKYPLKEDTGVEDMYDDLSDMIGSRSQRPVFFKQIQLDDIKNVSSVELKGIKHLNNDVEPDSVFLHDMMVLPKLVNDFEKETSPSEKNQFITLIEISSLAAIVKAYGKSSVQVDEAVDILNNRLTKLEEAIRKFYNDEVVIYSVNGGKLSKKSRTTRSVGSPKEGETDLNLAIEYSEDYPVVFNMVLVLGIILTLAVLATSLSMAYMDPGRDSIIYRMTNPRMKKDQ